MQVRLIKERSKAVRTQRSDDNRLGEHPPVWQEGRGRACCSAHGGYPPRAAARRSGSGMRRKLATMVSSTLMKAASSRADKLRRARALTATACGTSDAFRAFPAGVRKTLLLRRSPLLRT